MTDKRGLIAEALEELVQAAKSGGPKVRVGLMARGSEHGPAELARAARSAQAQDPRLAVVLTGPRLEGFEDLEWIETPDCEADVAQALETALAEGRVEGAVALHYPFPLGVTTVGRVVTPGKGKPLILASTTGASSSQRLEAMVRNAILGRAVARSLGMADPTVGVLNVDGAQLVVRALGRLAERGYPIRFGESVRADGGAVLRGNDLLAGAVDLCVTDTLTGNVLVKLFSAFTTGGSYEASGWGYGPSVGEGWPRVVSIISRASGEPVVAGALLYTASVVRGKLPERVAEEMAAAKAAGLEEVLVSLAPKPAAGTGEAEVSAPPKEPTEEEIHGIDVLSVDDATRELWKAGVYAESAMGCTGPVVKVPRKDLERAEGILKSAGYL